jgi:hypothetical protein
MENDKNIHDITQQLSSLKYEKDKAVQNEDYAKAMFLKAEMEKFENQKRTASISPQKVESRSQGK